MTAELGAQGIIISSDSQLVTQQVTRECDAKDPKIVVYRERVAELKSKFHRFEVHHIPREENIRRMTSSSLVGGTGKVTLVTGKQEGTEPFAGAINDAADWRSEVWRALT